MRAFSLERSLANGHLVEHLRFVLVARNALAHIVDILEISLFPLDKRRAGINPHHVAVFMGAKVKRTAKIVLTLKFRSRLKGVAAIFRPLHSPKRGNKSFFKK